MPTSCPKGDKTVLQLECDINVPMRFLRVMLRCVWMIVRKQIKTAGVTKRGRVIDPVCGLLNAHMQRDIKVLV